MMAKLFIKNLFAQFRISKQKSISLLYFNLLLAIWLGLILNYSFYEKIHQLTPYQNLKSGLLLVATALVIIAAYNLVIQCLSWKWNAKFVASLLIIIGGLSAYFVNSLGVVITPDQIQNMLQTDVREVRDLWSIRLLIWMAVFVVLPLSLMLFLKIESNLNGTAAPAKITQ